MKRTGRPSGRAPLALEALGAPVSTRIRAAGIVRLQEPEHSIHDPGRRLGGVVSGGGRTGFLERGGFVDERVDLG